MTRKPSQPKSQVDTPGPIAGRTRRAVIVFAILTIALITADLVTKSLAFGRLAGEPVTLQRDADGRLDPIPPHPPHTFIPGFIALQLTVNEGAIFGLGQGGRWIFVAFSLIAVGIVVSLFARSPARARILHFALACVLAGAMGNLYDRVFFGVVRDMIRLFPETSLPFGWSWPDGSRGLYPWIFNVADVCLVVGLVLLLFTMSRPTPKAAERRA